MQRVPPFSRVFCSACGSEQRAAGVLGSYLVLDLLGHGGMGAVFRGIDRALDRPVAIKVLAASADTGPDALEQFRREAKAAAQINHINVARIFAFGIEHGQPYIVMEFVNGRSLMGCIEDRGPLDVPFALHIGIQTAEGLAAAAANGLVHGDVKPENILVDENATPKLIDFGLASLANRPGSREIWGTPYYISPERLIAGRQIDFRSDLYSLGGTLYHALTGKPPFDGASAAEVARARLKTVPLSPAERRPGIDREVSDIVMRALQREPVDRYPSYDSMVGDMRRVTERVGAYARRKKRSGILVSARQTASIVMPREEPRRRPALAPILVTGIALLAVGGAAVFFLNQPVPPPPPASPPPDNNRTNAVEPVAMTTNGPTPVSASNDAPPSVSAANVRLFAWRDEATTEPNTPVVIDVLANDAHPDGVAPEIAEVTPPSHGKATVTSSGKLSYVPETDFMGEDSFAYKIRHSSGNTARATVTVKVVRTPPPPKRPVPPAIAKAEHTNRIRTAVAPPPVASNSVPTTTGTVVAAAPPEPEWTSDAIPVRFSTDDIESYAIRQVGAAKSFVILDGGKKIRLMGQVWLAMPIRYLVTTNTVLECVFSSSREGDVHAIGLDDQTKTLTEAKMFQLHGKTPSRAARDFMTYDQFAPAERGYRIPVGRYYTGRLSFLIIGTTDGAQQGDATFSAVLLHEVTNTVAAAAGTKPQPATPPHPVTPPLQLLPGLKATIRESGKKDILKSGVQTTLQFDYGQGNVLGSGRNDNLDVEFTGFLTVPQEGAYRFNVSADELAEIIIDNNSVAKAEVGKDQTSGDVKLTAGRHRILIRFQEKMKDCYMRVKWIRPGRASPEPIPQSALSHTP